MNNINFNKFNHIIDDFINYKIKLDIEKNLIRKNINLLMDTEIFDKHFMFKDNFLNISCNNGFYYFENNNIKINYNFCSIGNNIFISNYLGYSINEKFFNNKNINFIFLQNNSYFKLLQNNNFDYNKIKKNDFDKLKCCNNGIINSKLYSNLLKNNKKTNFNKFNLSSFSDYYIKLKENDLNITTFTRTLLILLNLNCNIKINGFSCNLIETNYHSKYYYKYSPMLDTRINTNSINLKHLKNQNKHFYGVIKDNYVLYYLLKKYPDRISINDKIKKILFKKFDNI